MVSADIATASAASVAAISATSSAVAAAAANDARESVEERLVVEFSANGELGDSSCRHGWSEIDVERLHTSRMPESRCGEQRMGRRVLQQRVRGQPLQGRVHHVGIFESKSTTKLLDREIRTVK